MSSVVSERNPVISPERLQAVFHLYDQGLYRQAYELATSYAPLDKWRGTAARLLAGRMAGNLGNQKLGDWHFIHAYRQDPTHPDACWYYANYLSGRRGPLYAWRFLKQRGPLPDSAPLESRAHWLALHGSVLGRLRDFDAAEEWLAKAEALGHVHPWVTLERAALCSLEDRHDEAEQYARKALEQRPWYRPAVQWVAHFLVEKERDQEAIQLLGEAGRRLESGAVWAQLATLQFELKQYTDCRDSLDQFERLSPLLDKALGEWLSARRSDIACFLGEYDRALEYAKKVPGNFYEHIARRLENPPADTRRVLLNVGFVRQNYHTCAPATVASITRFWDLPADHLEMAGEISYAGTPHHNERRWAEGHGFVVREFTVTWESAVALIDRGVPFTLTTTEPTSAHLQSCIGYDAHRGTLLIRDPSLRNSSEFLADAFFERYKSTGPRGKALVPKDRANLLDGLNLPDSALYDQIYAEDCALDRHDRAAAENACRALEKLAPDHFLTWYARKTLAHYDSDPTQVLACVDKLLAKFPDDIFLRLNRVACLRELSRREEYVATLKQLAEKTPTDPVCWQRYGYELIADAREHDRAGYLLRRAVRTNPGYWENYLYLAELRWAQQRFDEATELYRFAFCLEDKYEHLAQAYFSAARNRGRTEEALGVLRRRFERFGAKNWKPARTLFDALVQLERMPEAFGVLDRAVALRPDDGELVLHLAEACTLNGNFARGEEMLAKAKGRSQHTAWLRTAARLASGQGETGKARELWAEVLKVQPIAADAHRAYVQLLADAQGRQAALAHLEETCKRFPHNIALNKLWMDWLREGGAKAVEPVLRKLVDTHPGDAWTRRELAWQLIEQGRLDEADPEIDAAAHLEPNAPALHSLRAQLLQRRGKVEEAKEHYRKSIRLSVDYDYAIHELVIASETHAERREALLFIHSELMKQTIYGEGLLAFRDAARLALEPEELLQILRDGQAARPDLWHAWAALVKQLADMDRLDEAHALATQMVERFPLLPGLWLDLANVCKLRKDEAGEIAALDRALQINPGWSNALRQLAYVYERREDFNEAENILNRAVSRAPLMASNHLDLAELYWRKEDKPKALERVKHAFDLDPGLDAAWDRLCDWSRKLDRANDAVEAARQLTKRRPIEARSWLRLAQAYSRLPRDPEPAKEKERIDDAVKAFDRAIFLNPRQTDFYDQKAITLAQAQRWDDAFAACRPAAWGDRPPLVLQGRSAWLEAAQQKHDKAIERMREVLKDDPKYFWGWTQLADWYQATGKHAEYLKAADELCKLAPHTPQPIAYRGEAKIRLDQRDAGLADLREAVRIAPDFALAGFLLFDEHFFKDDTTAEAEKWLAHLKKHVGGDAVAAREIQLRARNLEHEPAEAALKELCFSKENAVWALDTAANAFAQAGWTDRLTAVFKDVTRKPNWNTHVATVWAERTGPQAPRYLDECLAALDKARERNPGDFSPIDRKAELLALTRRFDRAIAFLQDYSSHAEFGVYARGRLAWIERQRGNQEEALAQMRKTVRDDPRYYWGWLQLADWYDQMGRHDDHRQAAEKLIEIGPGNGFNWAHRAAARRNLNDRQGAKDDFRKAMELSPGYEWAAFCLFDMQHQYGEYKEAEETLQKMGKAIHPKEVAYRRILLAGALTQPGKAIDAAVVLCDGKTGRSHLLDQAFPVFTQAGWTQALADMLSDNLHRGEYAAGKNWVYALSQLGTYHLAKPIEVRLDQDDVDEKSLVGALDAAALLKNVRLLNRLAARYRDRLRKSVWAWGNVGGIYAKIKQDRQAAEWMRDWKDRPRPDSWMLLNLAMVLRSIGQDDEAHEVGEHALAHAKEDWTTPHHESWLVMDDILGGLADPVQEYFAENDLGRLDDYHYFIALCAKAILITQTAYDKGYAFAEARHLLAQTARACRPVLHDDALLRYYKLTVSRVAANCGGLNAKLWAFWRRWNPLLPPKRAEG